MADDESSWSVNSSYGSESEENEEELSTDQDETLNETKELELTREEEQDLNRTALNTIFEEYKLRDDSVSGVIMSLIPSVRTGIIFLMLCILYTLYNEELEFLKPKNIADVWSNLMSKHKHV
ncbi:agmatine deiminase [Acrasis kona]|uniref:Agmatine deiminase n=1 Tax=Acrasis kona TaxID=1008807 RepID=A0AAW2ZJG8_9EUKA